MDPALLARLPAGATDPRKKRMRNRRARAICILSREAKTDAGAGRRVDLAPALVEELTEWKMRSPLKGQSDPLFVARSRHGRHSRQTKDNVGRRLKVAIKRANRELTELGIEPISARVSPHSMRRTFASLRAALRDDPVYIAEQIGHADPRFTLRVYTKAAKRRERLSGAYLDAFDRALEWGGWAQAWAKARFKHHSRVRWKSAIPNSRPSSVAAKGMRLRSTSAGSTEPLVAAAEFSGASVCSRPLAPLRYEA